jgi:hypothetical protein
MLAGLPPLVQRARMETADNRVDLVADATDFTDLALQAGADPAAFLRQLHRAGVTSLGVAEDTIRSLHDQGLVQVWTAAQLAGLPLPPAMAGHAPVAGEVYVAAGEPDLAAWLRRSLAERLPADRVQAWGDVVAVRGSLAQLQDMGLGFRPGRLQQLAQLGFDIIPRLTDAPQQSAAAIAAEVADIAAAAPVHTVIFAGDAVTGFPDHLAATAQALAAHGWTVGVIETPQQLGNVAQFGLSALVAARPGAVVRVYSLPAWVLQRETPAGVNSTIVDAVTGRNLRVVYLHPYTPAVDPGNVLADNVTYWGQLAGDLRALGFQLGPARPFPAVRVPARYAVPLNVGVWAGALLLLLGLWPAAVRRPWRWFAVGAVAAALLTVAKASLARELGALVAAVAFPGLAALHVARQWDRWPEDGRAALGRIWRSGVATAAAAAGIAAVGAYFLSALLASTDYMQEWSAFRGVKLSYLLPPLLAGLAFLAAVGVSGRRRRGETAPLGRELAELLAMPVRGVHLLALGLLLAGAAYYVLRSGNVSITAVPAVEEQLRKYLAVVLVDRPREKEFLVGYPSLLLAVLAAARRRRGWFWLLLFGTSVGLVSLVNSFEHVRTPLVDSARRGLYGWVLGVGLGSLAVFAVAAVAEWWRRRDGPRAAADGDAD